MTITRKYAVHECHPTAAFLVGVFKEEQTAKNFARDYIPKYPANMIVKEIYIEE